jgi:hypothetical protein
VAVLAIAALLVVLGRSVWQWVWADSDGDGLPDRVEATGWATIDGEVHQTNPDVADSDGDGLTDRDEAGPIIEDPDAGEVYSGLSDPSSPDTDADGLSDGEERDLALDAREPDSDSDTLADGLEMHEIGSAPDLADTDGDGLDDGYEYANRDSLGLSPLWPDVETDKWAYAADFAKGALAGDLLREDSLAWLAGNLVSGGASSIPVVGQLVGGLADLRDAVGSSINGDWVGSGFSAIGLLPGGDAVAVPGKAAEFIARNPHLAAAAAALVASAALIPERIKLQAARRMWPGWDDLVSAGASEKALIQLQRGRVSLDDLTAAIKRPGHIAGAPAGPMRNWSAGEATLSRWYGGPARGVDLQVRVSTAACTIGCRSDIRIVDVLVDGVAHESKVGRVNLTPGIEGEIRKDAWLMQTGQITSAHWHFFASETSNTLGASKPVYDLLDELKVPYTLHLPSGG